MILAIDPGNEISGFVYCDEFNIIEAGNIKNEELLQLMLNVDFQHLVVERISSYGMTVGQTVFDTCIWIGRFIQQAEAHKKCATHLIPRIPIKVHHCKTAKAKDSNVIQALKDRFGPKGTKKQPGATYKLSSHSWQAYAIAVYFLDTLKEREILYNSKEAIN